MKKKINLLLRQKKYQEIAAKVEQSKKILLVGVFIAFLLVIVSFIAYMYTKKKLESSLLEKNVLLFFIANNREEEEEYLYFSNKEKQIRNIMKDDLVYGPYYELLRTTIEEATDAARIESLAVDKNRSVNFILTLPDYNSLISFLGSIETELFLRNFKSLSLTHFASIEPTYQSYRLKFKGQFKEENEN